MIKNIFLQNFRNHKNVHFSCESPLVAFCGDNGIGKTNILEAISVLNPGKGMRKDNFKNMQTYNTDMGWMVGLKIGDLQIGTFCDNQQKRMIKIDSQVLKNFSSVSQHIRIFWLTPENDGIFVNAPSEQRKFIDRMVYANNPNHLSNLKEYEHLIKERMEVLQSSFTESWLDILEEKISKLLSNITESRVKVLQAINHNQIGDDFPKFYCEMDGEADNILQNLTNQDFIDIAKNKYKLYRNQDKNTGTTQFGSHRSRLKINFVDKNQDIKFCSTGEQKIILIAFLLSFINVQLQNLDCLVVILLDDVISHLDFNRRMLLFRHMIDLVDNKKSFKGSLQVFMTGTDRDLFLPIQNVGKIFDINEKIELIKYESKVA
jgi:DNA replication and repair protein RecF